MYTYNLTFAVDAPRTAEFTSWSINVMLPALNNNGLQSTTLLEVISPGKPEPGASVSYALQSHFSNCEEIEKWKEDKLLPVLEECSERFGTSVCFFETLLRTLNINLQN